MDLMQIRRMLLSMVGGEDMGAWKQKSITIGTGLSAADDVLQWIKDQRPSNSTCLIVTRDNMDETSFANNQLVNCFSVGNTYPSYVRYRNSAYQTNTGWTHSYDLVMSAGDTYTIFYQE